MRVAVAPSRGLELASRGLGLVMLLAVRDVVLLVVVLVVVVRVENAEDAAEIILECVRDGSAMAFIASQPLNKCSDFVTRGFEDAS